MYVIGLCGFSGAGKSTIAKIIQEFKNDTLFISIGNILRNKLENEKLEINFNTLQSYNDKLKADLKNNYISIIFDYIEENKEIIIIDSLRTMDDFHILKKKFKNNFILLGIDAKEDIRFKRLISRGRNDKINNFIEFKLLYDKELGWGVDKLLKHTNKTFINNCNSYRSLRFELIKYLNNIT